MPMSTKIEVKTIKSSRCKISCYLPLFYTKLEGVPDSEKRMIALKADLNKTIPLPITINKNSVPMKLSVVKKIPSVIKKSLIKPKHYLHINLTASYNPVIELEHHKDHKVTKETLDGDKELMSFEKHSIKLSHFELVTEFLLQLDTILLALHLSHPAAAATSSSTVLFVDEKQIVIDSKFNSESFIQSAMIGLKQNWPKMAEIQFRDVWRWLSQFNDVHYGFSKSQVGRVVNALKHISKFQNENDFGIVKDIIWCAIAFESLFTKQSENFNDISLSKQIINKVISLFGPMPNNNIGFTEKRLRELYTFRSKLLHGETDFPAPDFPWEGDKDFEKYLLEWSEISFQMLTIIIATLQMLIQKKWKGLNFGFKYLPLNEKSS